MNERDLLGLIGQYEKSALGSNVSVGPSVGGYIQPNGQQMTTLEIDRYNALNAYFGRPLGNEVDNRSQIVLPELRDTIEWVMPQLMRMFAATPKICQFEPVAPGDEAQADLETEVVNAVFMKQNDGFFILHDFFKDALLLRNGYAKVWWEEREETEQENYTGLTEDAVTELLNPEDESTVEVIEQEETQSPFGPMFSLKIRRTFKKGQIKVQCIPPEEVLISPRARHKMDDTPFFEHKTEVSRSDLKEQGFDASLIDSITVSKPDWLNLISLARDEVVDELSEDSPSDKASEYVDFREVYIKVDFDGDGVAELRRVFIAGDVIIENEECPELPAAYCAPIRMPHRHVGISYYDLLNDLQVIKTTLFRNGLDNIYQTNNKRTVINENNVNVDDVLNNRPGGVIRTKGIPGEDVFFMETAGGMLDQIIPAMEYVDSIREMRTGIGKDTMGVDADALQDVTKGGQLAAMSAAAMKVELVARMLAEGVKDLFLKIHSALIRHQDKALEVEISGQWSKVDPSQWRKRSAVSVNVGLGSGNRQEAQGHLMMLSQMQEKIASFGLVGPKQAYETFKEGVRLLGFENPQRFALDPDSPEYQQHMAQQQQAPNPQMQVAQLKAQSAVQVEKMRTQRTQEQAQMASQTDLARIQADLLTSHAREQTARMQAQAEMSHGGVQAAQDREIEIAKMQSAEYQTLVKVIAEIVSQQLKQDPSVNAGQVLSNDVRTFQ